jgi:hypothetical protein
MVFAFKSKYLNECITNISYEFNRFAIMVSLKDNLWKRTSIEINYLYMKYTLKKLHWRSKA